MLNTGFILLRVVLGPFFDQLFGDLGCQITGKAAAATGQGTGCCRGGQRGQGSCPDTAHAATAGEHGSADHHATSRKGRTNARSATG